MQGCHAKIPSKRTSIFAGPEEILYTRLQFFPSPDKERINRISDKKETIYQNAAKVKVMQLPRGTFREIRKGETIGNILTELERTRFSGICSISSVAATGTLVLKSGKCILVKFQGKSGDAGWDELQKGLYEEVDAALSSLDDAQIQLSLEFNKVSRLIRGGKPAVELQKPASPIHEPVKKPAPPVQTASPVVAAKPAPKPAAPLPPVHRPAPPIQPKAAPEPQPQKAQTIFQRPAMPAPPAQQAPARQAEEKRAPPGEDGQDAGGSGSSFEKDIDTFDTMDLDNVTDKIRNDCKTMIKQLHLEHLMER
jgi:hypothetical protein